jgi:putative inorganic carbon (HCO3(-)) transporter
MQKVASETSGLTNLKIARLFLAAPLDWIEGGVLLAAAPFLLFPTVMPALTVVVLLALALMWIVRGIADRAPLPPTPLNGVLLIWTLMLGIGILVTALPDLTLPKATGLILGLAVWRTLTYTVTDRGRLRWAVIGFMALGLGMTGLGVLTTDWPAKIPLLRDLLALLPDRLLQLPEAPQAGVHANELGGTVVFYFPLVLSAFIGWQAGRHPRFGRAGAGLLTLAILGVLVLTQSRSAWLGTWGSCIGLLALWGAVLASSRRRVVLWGLAGALLLTSVLGVLWMGPERVQSILQEPRGMTALGSYNTLGFRYEVWRWAVAAVGDFPFTGCGLGTFREVVRLLYPIHVDPSYDIAHAHNIFLQVALDVGIPGLVSYLALLMVAGFMAWRTVAALPDQRVLILGLLGGMLALHIFGLLDALAPGSKPNLIFWYALGLLTALARWGGRERGLQAAEHGTL